MEKKLIKITFLLFFITALSKVIGFGREIVTGYFLGANGISDAYNLSLIIPNFFALIVQQTISIAFVPIYIQVLNKKSKSSADSFATKLLLLVISVFVIFSFIIFIFSDFFVLLFGSGLNPDSKLLASKLLKIGSWSLILQGFVLIFASRLQALKHFIIPALTGFALDISCFIFLIISDKTQNYYLLGLIPVVSLILQCFLLIPFSIKKGQSFKIKKPFFDDNIRQVFKIVIPALFSVGIYQINVLVDKNIASNIVEGGISSLNYSQNILNIFQALMINAIITPLYSSMSEFSANKDNEKLNKLLSSNLKLNVLLLLPISIFLFMYSPEIVTIIYSRGAFDQRAVTLTSQCLRGYSFSLVFVIINTLFTRYMYSTGQQKKAIVFSGISLIINICLNIIVYKITNFGIGGIAWATFVSTFANTLLLLLYIRKSAVCNFDILGVVGNIVKIVIAFVFSFSIVLGLKRFIQNYYLIMLLNMLLFIVAYSLVVLNANDAFSSEVKVFLKKKFKKSRTVNEIEQIATIKNDPIDSSNQ